jgi:hypothetical protein
VRANNSEIVFIVDRSGSMESIKRDMVGGFATLLTELRTVAGECSVTIVQFNIDYAVTFRGSLWDHVPFEIHPSGGTALLDAMGRAIEETGARLASMPESVRPGRVLVVVITDGEENSSRFYSRAKVFEMVRHQRERYAWEFMFLGANQDAITEAAKVGIRNSVEYTADMNGINAMAKTSGKSAARYRQSGHAFNSEEMQANYRVELGTPTEPTPGAPVIHVDVPTIPGAKKP